MVFSQSAKLQQQLQRQHDILLSTTKIPLIIKRNTKQQKKNRKSFKINLATVLCLGSAGLQRVQSSRARSKWQSSSVVVVVTQRLI